MRKGFVFLALTLLWTAAARGEEYTFGLHDVTVVQDGHGLARVLFRTDSVPASGRVLVERATLTVPYAGATEDRSTELRICPVTRAWGGGADWTTPFDEELYGRSELDLRRGSGVLSFDLTAAIRAARESASFADGFVLTLGAGRAGGFAWRISRASPGLPGRGLR